MKTQIELPDLSDQWIIITGGNGRLGASFVKLLVGLNANILIVDRHEFLSEDLAMMLKALNLRCVTIVAI